jgi:hypothetical protein
MRPLRHRRAATLAIVVVAACLVAHHSAIVLESHPHDDVLAVAELCLGVLTAVGAVATVAVFGLIPIRRRPPASLGSVGRTHSAPVHVPRARAGPPVLTLLCVLRR